MSDTSDKVDNEMITGAVYRSSDICLMAEENLSYETVWWRGCATNRCLKWGPLASNVVGRITQHVRKGEGKDGECLLSLQYSYITCCLKSHGLWPKKLSVNVAVPPAPSQRTLAPSVMSLMLVAKDKGNNEMILGAVHRSPGICLTAEENPRKPQLGDSLMKGLCD